MKSRLFGLMHTLTLIACLLITQSVLADKYSVCEAACDFTTIQGAVDFAQNGDTINISNGTYLEDITIIDKSLHLKGEDQIQTVINGTGPNNVITLECMNDYTSIKISNLSITGVTLNTGRDAVGIYNDQCSLTIRNSLIHHNSSDGVAGGGIVTNGPTFIENSTVADNGTFFGTGGIMVYGSGSSEIKNSVIARNANGCSAKFQGGGISNYGTDLSIINSIIIDNRSNPGCNGSGVYNSGSLSMKDSTVSGNINAGGIENWGDAHISTSIIEDNVTFGIRNKANLTLRSSLITNNNGPEPSGIKNYWPGTVDILSSTITNNDGGGIYNAGVMVIKSSTISDNIFTVFAMGGGIYNSGELVLKTSDIISNGTRIGYDQHGEGGGIYNASIGTVKASKTTIENNRPDNCGGFGFTCP